MANVVDMQGIHFNILSQSCHIDHEIDRNIAPVVHMYHQKLHLQNEHINF